MLSTELFNVHKNVTVKQSVRTIVEVRKTSNSAIPLDTLIIYMLPLGPSLRYTSSVNENEQKWKLKLLEFNFLNLNYNRSTSYLNENEITTEKVKTNCPQKA